jgi:2,3-bisphosphoglycerate-independent phosphoglycerate mutase
VQWDLEKNDRFRGARGPVVLAVLDGVGMGSGDESDAVRLAATPTLDAIWDGGARRTLRAHGPYVGLPSDSDMGNSEVGHNALGCGVVHEQGALLVDQAIESGRIFEGEVWKNVMARAAAGGAIHFIGLLSDGNVHSHVKHLFALLRKAASEGAKKLYVHTLLDGRDVDPTSALTYVDQLEEVLAELRQSGIDAVIASGGGRMVVTMDRYEADWDMVQRGWQLHVHGEGRRFASARAAIETFRAEDDELGDQFLPGFVVERAGQPVAPMQNGDAVVLTNFRGDRALEISRAFESDDFNAFDRGRRPDVLYAGMMEYDGDLHVPAHYLVEPPTIERTMGEFLARNKVPQLAISETQKYGHVTYFWNGNRTGKFDEKTETYVEIASDDCPFEDRPWMKAAEITDRLISSLRSGGIRFARVNYANGDMVGHTGDFAATVIAMQVIDLQLKRLRKAVAALDGVLVITADHGNADEMMQHGKDGRVLRDSITGVPVVKTSHTLNPVPFMIYDPNRADLYEVDESQQDAGLANVTATCFELLGFAAPEGLSPSLLRYKP